MNSHQLKLDESYLLFQNWWKSTELTNYEKCVLNHEIISFNQQLFRLKEKIIRIGVYGKTGVGKSSISNKILKENFFETGILNGSSKNTHSKEFSVNNNFIKSIELFDYPGFDVCNPNDNNGGIEHLNTHDVALCRRFITRPGSEQVHRFAFDLARFSSSRSPSDFFFSAVNSAGETENGFGDDGASRLSLSF